MDVKPALFVSHLAVDLQRARDKYGDRPEYRSLQASIFKKLQPDDTTELDAIAISKFRDANGECQRFDPSRIENALLEHLRKEFETLTWCGPSFNFDWCHLKRYAGFGPGASVATRHTSLPGKIGASSLSYSSNLQLAFYKECALDTPTRYLAEYYRQERWGCSRVQGSTITCVPKDSRCSRLICTEPLAAMFLQKAIGGIMERELKTQYGIDLRVQPEINKLLAREGSRTDSWSTIDLKSASDTISLKLCQAILPAALFELLMDARSPKTKVEGEFVDLHMLSTMGNGFTFPFQTFLFAAIAKFATRQSNDVFRVGDGIERSFSVFGDDIIVPQDSYERMLDCLSQCGFTVNLDKSFCTGPFRESCGGDYHNGVDVRGVYLKRFSAPEDYYLAFNLLLKWCRKHEVILFDTLLFLWRSVESPCYIPSYEDDTHGFKGFKPRVNKRGVISYRSYRSAKSVLKMSHFKRLIRKGWDNAWALAVMPDGTTKTAELDVTVMGHPQGWLIGVAEIKAANGFPDSVSVRSKDSTRKPVPCTTVTWYDGNYSDRLWEEAATSMFLACGRE